MPTLDEVIKAMENCYGSDAECCDKCSYTMEVTGHGVICRKCDLEDDALHYLKEFQGLSKMWNDKLDKEQENPPLTWDELKAMEGKPVWVEFLNYDLWTDPEHHTDGSWWVVGEVRKDDIIIAQYLDEAELCEEDLGEVWQAYRKERK